MNNEIKEMLDLINELVKISPNKGSYGISHKKWKQLLDYITNLQQENEELKEDKKKAVEYIKTTKFLYKSHYDFKQDLLNILQNGSDSQ